MQHDVHPNPTQRERRSYPFLVVLQADIVDESMKIVAPLIPAAAYAGQSRLLPVVEHDGQRYGVMFHLLTHMPSRWLKHPVGSLAAWRDDLSRALDWLFFGV